MLNVVTPRDGELVNVHEYLPDSKEGLARRAHGIGVLLPIGLEDTVDGILGVCVMVTMDVGRVTVIIIDVVQRRRTSLEY